MKHLRRVGYQLAINYVLILKIANVLGTFRKATAFSQWNFWLQSNDFKLFIRNLGTLGEIVDIPLLLLRSIRLHLKQFLNLLSIESAVFRCRLCMVLFC